MKKITNAKTIVYVLLGNAPITTLTTTKYRLTIQVTVHFNNLVACASGYIANGTCSEGLMSMDLNRPKPCESVSDCPLVDSNKTIIK